jgi:eukaryotic-like serine/threonine-protein kinase
VGATQKLLRFGVFELNLDTVELRKSGTVIKLAPLPFKLLVLLASHAGQLVSRDQIESALWGEDEQVDFEHSVNKCIKQIRTVLGDNADRPLYVETLPRQGYRFLAPVVSKTIPAPKPQVVESTSGERARNPAEPGFRPIPAPIAGAAVTQPVAEAASVDRPDTFTVTGQPRRSPSVNLLWSCIAVILATAVVGALVYWRIRPRPALTEKDTIVLADFDNKTGDSLFDDALKQALAVQLEQSPFLTLISDSRVNRTLKLMARPSDARLTPEVAREVCQRTGSTAMILGSIAPLGSGYAIGLKAVDCNSGEVLADGLTEANDKEHVLKALDTAATALRGKLGESLASVQKYATPLEEATTPSLDALQAFSLGQKTRFAKGETAALPFYERAVELDPGFARAYAALASCYNDLNEAGLAAENARKAYELRDKVSERERFYIESTYYVFTTGDLNKARKVHELWNQLYPRDLLPYLLAGYISSTLGDWDKALANAREGMRLDPGNGTIYLNVGNDYTALNRIEDAEAIYKEAEKHQLQAEDLLPNRYQLAFLQGDKQRMAQIASEAAGKPGAEDQVLILEAYSEAWHGSLKNARAVMERAMDSAQRNEGKETAASYEAAEALNEAAMGNSDVARVAANAALKLAPNRDVRAMSALALAQAGDIGTADKLAAELAEAYPQDTLVQQYWLPTIRAEVALQRNDPSRAIELLKIVAPIELGTPTGVNIYLSPVYVRGQAYLMLRDGPKAAAEFRKFVDHYGIVVNFPLGALARLGLARAYALQAANNSGMRDQARTAYQNFLTLWKDADSDVPVYQQALSEFTKL